MKDVYVAIELQLSFSNLARLKPEGTSYHAFLTMISQISNPELQDVSLLRLGNLLSSSIYSEF